MSGLVDDRVAFAAAPLVLVGVFGAGVAVAAAAAAARIVVSRENLSFKRLAKGGGKRVRGGKK